MDNSQIQRVSLNIYIFDLIRLIPSGKVTTYGAIAKFFDIKSARIIGKLLSQIDPSFHIPAHRVVNARGQLTGREAFKGKYSMEQLLQMEGLIIQNFRIKNFKSIFWDPNQELIL